MPELPEVETIVSQLRGDVLGRRFTSVQVYWAREIAVPDAGGLAERLPGQRVESLERRAKYVVFALSQDVLLVHLKMTGRLYVAPPGEARRDDRWLRVALAMDDGRELRFSDPRKFGRMYLVGRMEEVTGRIGPEPLGEAFTAGAFAALLARRRGAIKPLLLNQTFVAGLGNIYADEALWRARIDPRRRAESLTRSEIRALHRAIRGALADGVRHEGASIDWYRKPDGTKGESQNHFAVYDRADQPCPRCGSPIHKIWLGQRGTHFCAKCQH